MARTNIAEVLYKLTLPLRAQTNWGQVEIVAREALGIQEAETPNDWRTLSTRNMLGQALLEQTRLPEARTLFLSNFTALEQRSDKTRAEFQARYKDTASLLAQLCEANGETDQAAEWRERLAAIKKIKGEQQSTAPKQ
jgi:hypothetical protein